MPKTNWKNINHQLEELVRRVFPATNTDMYKRIVAVHIYRKAGMLTSELQTFLMNGKIDRNIYYNVGDNIATELHNSMKRIKRENSR